MNFFSKCDQLYSFLRIWSILRKKSLMENFIFCAVSCVRTAPHYCPRWCSSFFKMAMITLQQMNLQLINHSSFKFQILIFDAINLKKRSTAIKYLPLFTMWYSMDWFVKCELTHFMPLDPFYTP